MKKKFLILIPLCGILFSCSRTVEFVKVTSQTTFIKSTSNQLVSPFNTVMTLYYPEGNIKEEKESEISDAYLNETIRLHKIFDRHYYYQDGEDIVTNVRVINDSYGSGNKVYCSDELYELLKKGCEMTSSTEGRYNFFAGKIVTFWENILSEVTEGEDASVLDPYYSSSQKEEEKKLLYSIPSLEECKSLLTFFDDEKAVIFNALEDISYNGELLSRSDKDSSYRAEITSGGIAKGLATDYLKSKVKEEGLTCGFLNSGRSSITSIGDTSYLPKKYQTFGVAVPDAIVTDETAFKIKLYGEYNLSTSGNYNGTSYKLIDKEGNYILRHHIIDLTNGEPSLYHSSVTLLSYSFTSGELDALSTAYMNSSSSDINEFTHKLLNKYENHDLAYIVVDDGESKYQVRASSYFKGKITYSEDKVEVTYE